MTLTAHLFPFGSDKFYNNGFFICLSMFPCTYFGEVFIASVSNLNNCTVVLAVAIIDVYLIDFIYLGT